MSVVNRETIEKLINETKEQNVSIFIPTHKTGEEGKQDALRLKNILQKVKNELLERGWKENRIDELFKPIYAKTEENQFWLHQDKGLALYVNEKYFDFFKIPVSPKENFYISENFLVTPLLELQNHHNVYHVLVLSQSETKMFKVEPSETLQVKIESVPTSMEEHLKFHDYERSVQHHSGSAGGGSVFHGQGGESDDSNKELELFLKHIENKVTKYLNKANGPLILAGPDKTVSYYKKVNKYINILDKNIIGNCDSKTVQEIENESWAIAEPYFREEIHSDIERFNNLKGSELISTDMIEIVKGAYFGKVDTLFVPMGFHQYGYFDAEKNQVETTNQSTGESVDLINLAAISAIKNGSTLYGLPPSEVPNNSSLAAIYRYKT